MNLSAYDNLLTLLRNAIFEQSSALPTSPDWPVLMQQARIHGVEPLVYDAALRLPPEQAPDKALATQMKQVCLYQMQRQTIWLPRIQTAVEALRKAGVEPVLLKGFGLAELYPKPYLRSWGDADIWVGVKNYHAGCKALREAFPDRTVGLIPAAVGGTSAAAWKPGGEDDHQPGRHPYDDAIRMARTARQSGEIVAVLWHQGENDAQRRNPHYLADLHEIVTNFRRDLNLGDDVPFIAGELGDFYKPEIQAGVHIVDDALRELEREFAFFRVVPLKGLPHKGDFLHFSAEAQHEYGRRCFAEFCRFRHA